MTLKPVKPIAANLPRIGIGQRNEKSLHAALKQWYARPGDEFEVKTDGYIIDLVREGWLIEIQTRNLASIRRKLLALLEQHRVRLIYPIAQIKWIVHLKRGTRPRKRKSPKVGRLEDLFHELVSIPDLFKAPNFSLQVVMTQEEEVRRADGRGSWRRKRQSLHDHRLINVVESVIFERKEDFLRFLPADLPQPFSNKSLAEKNHRPVHEARRITYCLKKMGLIREVGKKRNELLFEITATSGLP